MITIKELKEHCERQLNKLPKGSKTYEEHLLTLNIIETLKEKDKQIDLMAERIEWLCKNFGILLDEEHDENFTQEDIKQYFERKVKK